MVQNSVISALKGSTLWKGYQQREDFSTMVVSGNIIRRLISMCFYKITFTFSCQYCHTQLRLGSYSFDKDGQYGYKFFCPHHYGMQGELRPTKVTRKVSQRMSKENKSPEKKVLSGVAGVDLLDRGIHVPQYGLNYKTFLYS